MHTPIQPLTFTKLDCNLVNMFSISYSIMLSEITVLLFLFLGKCWLCKMIQYPLTVKEQCHLKAVLGKLYLSIKYKRYCANAQLLILAYNI